MSERIVVIATDRRGNQEEGLELRACGNKAELAVTGMCSAAVVTMSWERVLSIARVLSSVAHGRVRRAEPDAPFCMCCGARMMSLRHSMGWGCVVCNVSIAWSLPERLAPIPPAELTEMTKWDPVRGDHNELHHTDTPCFVCTTDPDKDGTPHANEVRR